MVTTKQLLVSHCNKYWSGHGTKKQTKNNNKRVCYFD